MVILVEMEKTVGIGKGRDGSDNTTDNAVLKLDYQFGDSLFTSITGYSGYGFVDSVDVDWLPLQFIARDDDQTFKQYSQEFRITSPGGQFFDYVAGLYYEQSDLEFDRRVTIDTTMGDLFQHIPVSVPFRGVQRHACGRGGAVVTSRGTRFSERRQRL